MVEFKDDISKRSVVTDSDMENSGIPAPGTLGAAKKPAWALAAGIFVLVALMVAAIIDSQF